MEEIKDLNLEEIKKYLIENGLDENLASSPFFVEKFSDNAKVIKFGGPTRLIIYFDKEKNLIIPYFRDIKGKKTKGPEIRIRKEGKIIIIEELLKKRELIHYTMDDPTGIEQNSDKYILTKTTYYLDENGELELARETRQNFSLNAEISEKDLYSESANVHYEINEEVLKGKNPSDYYLITMIRKLLQLQKDIENLTQENVRQRKMLEKALSFAEIVRKSNVGKLFFEKKAKKMLGKTTKNSNFLPDGRDE